MLRQFSYFLSLFLRLLKETVTLGKTGQETLSTEELDTLIAAKPLTGRPKVSLIIAFYQTEPYLAESIQSALESKDVDLELILVDDGSRDGSAEIARDFAGKFSNIKLITLTENRGVYFARNLALLEATGDYIAFLDSDDIQAPERLSRQVAALEAKEGDISLCMWSRWNSDFSDRLVSPTVAMISLLFRRSLIDEVGFFHTVRWGADREYIKRVEKIRGAKKTVFLKEELMRSRLRDNSLTTTPGSEFFVYSTKTNSYEVRPSSSRLIYRDRYEGFHKRNPEKEALFQDFPIANPELKPVDENHSSLTIDPKNVLIVQIGINGRNRGRSEGNHLALANVDCNSIESSEIAHSLLKIAGIKEFVLVISDARSTSDNHLRKSLAHLLNLAAGSGFAGGIDGLRALRIEREYSSESAEKLINLVFQDNPEADILAFRLDQRSQASQSY